VGVIWDAINDPLVGMLTDRIRTRWGRRRPFLAVFAIPYALGFLALWWAPPTDNPWLKLSLVTLAFMLSDTLQTLVIVPFLSLTPEISRDYDERTSLTGYRMFFNLMASLVTAVAAPMIVDASLAAGGTLQQGYMMVAGLFGGLAALPFLLIAFTIREHPTSEDLTSPQVSLREALKTIWNNVPFRYASTLYMLNWITFDLVALMLPFFLVYWVAQGDLLAKVNLLGLDLAIESAVLGLLIVAAVAALPVWMWLANRLNKSWAYIIGMVFWAGVQAVILLVQPGQIGLILVLATLAGVSVSTAHVLPDAIFPDVIEWDELRTRRRQEGIYYGAKNFFRKLTGAAAIFLALQVLGWFGYRSPTEGAVSFTQSETALTAIRWLTGPTGAILLGSAIAVAWFYPLSRERHARIRRLLAERKTRREGAAQV
jgi:GPH family glycoside/pentoside/hexuronide:cation symporter